MEIFRRIYMSRETNLAAVSIEACEINEDGEIKYFPAHGCDPEARIPGGSISRRELSLRKTMGQSTVRDL